MAHHPLSISSLMLVERYPYRSNIKASTHTANSIATAENTVMWITFAKTPQAEHANGHRPGDGRACGGSARGLSEPKLPKTLPKMWEKPVNTACFTFRPEKRAVGRRAFPPCQTTEGDGVAGGRTRILPRPHAHPRPLRRWLPVALGPGTPPYLQTPAPPPPPTAPRAPAPS